MDDLGDADCTKFLYFNIERYPLNIYEVYGSFKNVLYRLSTSGSTNVHFHLVITFNDQTILHEAEVVEQCNNIKQLLDGKLTVFFETIQFSCAFTLVYNPFAETLYSPMCCVNTIQTMVNEATLHNKLTTSFSNNLIVSGTDVALLADNLTMASLSNESNPLHAVVVEPIPLPQKISSIITSLHLDQSSLNQPQTDPTNNDEMNLFFHENINSHSTISLIDSMKKFIQHDKNKIQHVV